MCLKRLSFKKIDSTSAFTKRRRFVLRNFTFVSAKYQTAGRGRTGRTWESKKGENLLFSFLVKDSKCKDVFAYLSMCSAFAVKSVLEKFGVRDLSIKWPNDVYVGGKKICGILLDGCLLGGKDDDVIIGVGINVNQSEFSGEFLQQPTSVYLQTGKKQSIKRIKKEAYSTLEKEVKKVLNGDLSFVEEIKKIDFLKGKSVYAEVCGEKKLVTVKGINDDCSLKAIVEGKEVNLFFGEISFHAEDK